MAVDAEVLEQLVRRSLSSDAETRNAALKQMLELPDEALLQILASHSRHADSMGRRLRRRLISVLPYTAFALAIAIALSRDPSAGPRLKDAIFCVGAVIALLLLGTAVYSLRSTRLAGNRNGENVSTLPFAMMLLLVGRTDRRFLPYLLSEIDAEFTLFERSRADADLLPPALPLGTVYGGTPGHKSVSPHALSQIRQRYRKLLKGMLAQIGPEETMELSTEQRHSLLLLLQIPEEDVDLTVDIIEHLEQWGDARATSVLKRLIREEHWYVGSDRVETAARQCLEQIETRLQQQKQSNILLRPTLGTEAVPPRSLLRPAVDPPEIAPEQLLRPESAPPEKLR